MKPQLYYFEDFEENESFKTVAMTLTEEAITRFGMEWDFQEFHIDKRAAKHSIFWRPNRQRSSRLVFVLSALQ
jgi:acyl dehydratase